MNAVALTVDDERALGVLQCRGLLLAVRDVVVDLVRQELDVLLVTVLAQACRPSPKIRLPLVCHLSLVNIPPEALQHSSK